MKTQRTRRRKLSIGRARESRKNVEGHIVDEERDVDRKSGDPRERKGRARRKAPLSTVPMNTAPASAGQQTPVVWGKQPARQRKPSALRQLRLW